MLHNLIIYGGSFDPIHYGHLNTALAIQRQFNFQRFIFLPCKTPILKSATMASCTQRHEMLKLALITNSAFEIDLREMERETPSFMVDTLESFHHEAENPLAITLLIGMDVFMQLPQWHCWQKLLTLCHLLVIERPEAMLQNLPACLKHLLADHETSNQQLLYNQAGGKIFRFDAGQYPISSTQLRKARATGASIRPFLPPAVYQYIEEQALYQ